MSKKKKGEAWGENGFEEWGGYMAAKQAKLEEQFLTEASKESENASNIFQGVAIFVNGYTDPTADELRRLMMVHGGIYHHYMRPQATTHIIASNLPYSKIILYRKSQHPIPICKPQWILDSIKAGRVLNFQKYLLYSNHTGIQPQLKYKIQDKESGNDSFTLNTHTIERDNETTVSKNKGDNGNGITSTVTKQEISSSLGAHSSKDARSTKDSGFISEFYNHSRLHHIATMGATFKDYVNELRDKSNGKLPGLARLSELKDRKLFRPLCGFESSFNNEILDLEEENKTGVKSESIIMHIDMDCFFVSVGLRERPELKGQPVAVAHAKGNKHPTKNRKEASDDSMNGDDELGSLSEVACCSYEARKAGVKNGMFLGEALKICPNLKTMSYDFEGYKEVSYMLYDTVASYTLNIEAVSCDEMYADCTKIVEESSLTPMEFATIIRQEIRDKTGCPVSTGFGCNKLLARLATRKAKPDGQFYMTQEHIETCIGTLNVQDLPGVGWTTTNKLNDINVRTCAELRAISLSALQKEFGKKTGEVLHNMCRGIDNSKLNLEHIRKSVSAEVNYGIRFECNQDAIDFLTKLSEEVCNRLKKANARGRCITLKLMVRAKEASKETAKFMGHGLCDNTTKSKNLIAPIDDVDIVTKEVISLWNQMQTVPEDARGIGIQITRLEILKSKSRDITLTSFINKNKQTNTICRSIEGNKPNEIQSTVVVKKASFDDQLNPANINESILSELPEEIRNEILHLQKNQNVVTAANAEDKQTNTICRSTEGNKPNEIQSTVVIEKANFDDQLNPANINESILSELPEEIRNEILHLQKNQNVVTAANAEETNANVSKVNEKTSQKQVQTRHENFFKQTKSGIPRSTKVEMPPIQEIDMSVLIELPEDIRNEILNEYSIKRNQSKSDGTADQNGGPSSTSKTVTARVTHDEENISFSQVDPEFLAALSEDLKRDVQFYCKAKKAESSKTDKDEVVRTSGPTRIQNGKKENKKVERNSKAKNVGKNSKAAAPKNNKKKGIQAAFKSLGTKNEAEGASSKRNSNSIIKSIIVGTERSEIANDPVTTDDTEAILSHNRTISEDNESATQHQDILIDLVNRLLHLPLKQVKMQIQIWITNSKIVNEVDFLSLATFLSMLPEKKRIEDLHVLLKTMHRYMTRTGDCVWHRTYRKTVKYVQHYMQIEYNSNLMVPPIECNHLQCNNHVV